MINNDYMKNDLQIIDSPSENASHLPSRVRSDALLGQAKELVIVHNGREYRLRMTQNGKLILTA
jgi:hemin uptake protein HemP